MVCANASGTHTLPLLVIGKSKKPCYFKNVSCHPTLYKVQKSAWMNSTLFSEWYSKDFIPNVKKLREREGKTGRVLLILNNAPCHPPDEILNAIYDNLSVMYLPPNITPSGGSPSLEGDTKDADDDNEDTQYLHWIDDEISNFIDEDNEG
ncbi:jerky protein homolog-like [Trichonephila inaurata madagascariensis]|uniref:Jerky protein homolog-like n=1 Tax=Trichonephila inaurata madagascariensis TaxID=2747483 RepID=A0A8X6M6B0_9ARAC|nr:jerky protein homolog-like [Trichonephila inaurata madagascariensis]